MRDITQDLQDRLGALEAERNRLQKRITDLEEQRALLTALLQQERRRWSDSQEELPTGGHMRLELSEIIHDIMSDGTSWLGKAVAGVAMKRGYQFGKSKPGRVIHSTLIGMQNKGQVKSLGEGKCKLASQRETRSTDVERVN